MADLLRKPEIALRKQPLGFARGEDLIMRVEERLPDSWSPVAKDSDVKTFQAQAFSYLREFRMEGHRVHLTQTFRSKADHVPVEQLADHAKTMDKASDWVGHELPWDLQGPRESRGSGSLGKGILALIGMLVIWIGAFHGLNWLGRRRLAASLARNAALSAEPPSPPAHRSPDALSPPDRH